LQWTPGSFCDVFAVNQQRAVESSLDDDVVVDAIRHLSLPWNGTLKMLLSEIAESEHKPKSPKGLSNALKRKAPALRQIGIDVDLNPRREGTQRFIEIRPTSGTRGSIPMTNRSFRERLTSPLAELAPAA
jgi:hypothetical protein